MVIGRASERAKIEAFVGDDGSVARALVLEGEPGIGKSTLWRLGLDAASRHGSRALTARPAAGEARLPYSALGDLLEAVPATAFERLLEAQRGSSRCR